MSKAIKVLSLDEAVRLDMASSTIMYVGKAVPTTLNSAAAWKITRYTLTAGGNVTSETVALGNYTQIWDNRASLSYL